MNGVEPLAEDFCSRFRPYSNQVNLFYIGEGSRIKISAGMPNTSLQDIQQIYPGEADDD
mgnify:CR=1 FL=1|jgi:hypothetical protein